MGGWDYWTYQAQPAYFISEIWQRMVVEKEVARVNTPAGKPPITRR